jgi:hypothetical protein
MKNSVLLTALALLVFSGSMEQNNFPYKGVKDNREKAMHLSNR